MLNARYENILFAWHSYIVPVMRIFWLFFVCCSVSVQFEQAHGSSPTTPNFLLIHEVVMVLFKLSETVSWRRADSLWSQQPHLPHWLCIQHAAHPAHVSKEYLSIPTSMSYHLWLALTGLVCQVTCSFDFGYYDKIAKQHSITLSVVAWFTIKHWPTAQI